MSIWSMWEEICPFFNFCRKHFWSIEKSIWLDKKVFHWRVETSLNKDGFIMYYFLQEPRIIKFASCFHSLVISTCHNGKLLITHPQRPWCSKKIRTTTITAFLISNTVVQNSYSNSTAFDPQSFAPLSWVPGPFNRSTSLWYSILYNL